MAISLLFGLNPLDVLVSLQGGALPSAPTRSTPPPTSPGSAVRDETKEFIIRILGDTADTWKTLFGQMGGEYHPPLLVLFRGAVDSACGLGSSAVGPFYCSPDSRVYLDRSFFEALAQRFGAPSEFTRAYVIAHEIGHHVQNQLGITANAGQQRARAGEARSNAASVRIELQADCLAGVWGSLRPTAEPARAGRRGIRARSRGRHRRRSPPTAVTGLRCAGVLHPPLLGPARALVRRRSRLRRCAPVRYFRDRPAMRAGLSPA